MTNLKPTTVPVRLPSGKTSSAIRYKAVTPAPSSSTGPSAGPTADTVALAIAQKIIDLKASGETEGFITFTFGPK